ncbi:transposase [Nostoc sp. FACHB-888]|nr:transposase [Nostoc sp. FACHB-888]
MLEHGSATVGFEDYCPVLETTLRLLPPECQVTLLADRGFEHGALIRWLREHQWSWCIRAKSDLNITLSNGQTAAVADKIPQREKLICFEKSTFCRTLSVISPPPI